MRDNEYTPFEEEETQYDHPEPTRKKEKTSTPKPKKEAKPKSEKLKWFVTPARVITAIGALLTILSIFLFFGCVSYFLTWKADQDSVLGYGFFEYIFNNDLPAPDNWLGKLGAWFSHTLIYNSLGITSIGFSFIGFLIGVRMLFNVQLLPLLRTSMITLSFMVWGSIFLGYFHEYINYGGGIFGFFINEWLSLTIGSIPTFILHIVLLYITITLLFNPNYGGFLERIKPSNLNGDYFDINEDQESPVEKPYNSMKVVNPIKENEITEDLVSRPVHFDEPEPDEDELIDDSELEITFIDKSQQEAPSDLELEINDNPEAAEVAEAPTGSSGDTNADDLVSEFGLYDPKMDLESYLLPPIELLKEYGGSGGASVTKEELESNKDRIVETLSHYKIDIAKIKATVGPTVTLYEIIPAPGVRIAKIKNLEDDIALSLSALGIRIIAPIPGKGTIGIEVPNSKPEMVSMRSLIASEKFQNFDGELPIVMGKTITNETYVFDLTKMPHLLVAGATGQGKSVGLNAILVSLLYKKHPAQVKFVLVDPKKVELTLYNKIERHFLAKLPGEEDAIIVDTSKVVNTLNSLCIEMDDRYELLKNAGVRTIKEYNAKFIGRKLNPEKGHRYLPYIVVLIDEFADLIMTAGKEVEHPIARIAQLARAIGIHLIVATQRPSVNIITGMIKANFPARIAFRVLSKIDSRTILDDSGADQLIGRGDMLISTGSDMIRLQCGFVDTPEVEEICEFVGDQRAYPSAFLLPEYVPEGGEGGGDVDMDEIDPMFVDSARIVVMNQQGSASLLQRKLKLGYNRAGRIVDQLEAMGIIGSFQGSKAREVLFGDIESLDEFLRVKGLL
ncbi:MAG: DNA translocase FtsK 4TM domain-containing protein [Flavobacteriales bacterium]